MPNFSLMSLTPRPFAFVSRSCAAERIGPTMAEAFSRLGDVMTAAGVRPDGPPLTHYRRIGKENVTFDVGFPISEEQFEALRGRGLSLGTTASGQAMKALHVGAYERLPETYFAVLSEMRARKLEATEDMWESYLSPPGTPAFETATEILWPVRGTA